MDGLLVPEFMQRLRNGGGDLALLEVVDGVKDYEVGKHSWPF